MNNNKNKQTNKPTENVANSERLLLDLQLLLLWLARFFITSFLFCAIKSQEHRLHESRHTLIHNERTEKIPCHHHLMSQFVL